jgi:hypothetical protein
VDTLNRFAVTSHPTSPPVSPRVIALGLARIRGTHVAPGPLALTVDEAINLAAWLVVGATLAQEHEALSEVSALVRAIGVV